MAARRLRPRSSWVISLLLVGTSLLGPGCLAVKASGVRAIDADRGATHRSHAGRSDADRMWPIGETAGGRSVHWTARRPRHAAFHQGTRWWGAATTRVRIRGPAAPHVYAFHVHLPRGVRLVENSFGEVLARRAGHPVGILGQPWARDSDGHHLGTWYTVHRRVVRQHIRFGPRARFPITADPWWNPFTWHWRSAFVVAWHEVRSCGQAAVTTMSYLAAPTVATNVLLIHAAGKVALTVPGGGYAYAGLGVYGCIGSFFGDR
jgi:hypothetical protein